MIKKRNQADKKIEIVDDNSSTISTPFERDIPKNYKEKAIEVLNLLDKQGIDIYSEDNYPGMYLKRKKSDNISESLKTEFSKNNKKINNVVQEENSGKLQNLFEYIKNNKNK